MSNHKIFRKPDSNPWPVVEPFLDFDTVLDGAFIPEELPQSSKLHGMTTCAFQSMLPDQTKRKGSKPCNTPPSAEPD